MLLESLKYKVVFFMQLVVGQTFRFDKEGEGRLLV